MVARVKVDKPAMAVDHNELGKDFDHAVVVRGQTGGLDIDNGQGVMSGHWGEPLVDVA